jgi:DNA helicase-2/ATP-dependent DNA helicase PcrA
VDERSIVDALDGLPPDDWTSRHGRRLSRAGRARLEDLAAVLRAIRAQTFLPVVDLVAETERLLGLDIEVAARPGTSPAGARANLDAFRSVAATFDTTESSTLGAFLAWLEAAEREERGLEAPVTDVDPTAVQLMTVHAAKGLEWDVVAVPGLVDGGFPSLRTPADGVPVDPGWLTARGALPASLRGDRESLPEVNLVGAADATELVERITAYRVAAGAHQIAEERRLAYVAVTRARRDLLLTGSWWREGTRPRTPSTFLTELAQGPLVEDGTVTVADWAPDPVAVAEAAGTSPVRPEGPVVEPATWPQPDVLGDRQRALEGAARAVLAAEPADLHARPESVTPDGVDLSALAALLLDERARGARDRDVALPAHLSASAVVRLGDDPEEFARQLRRPVPQEPSTRARRGTDFHAWVERWYGRAALVDVDLLPGADDDSLEVDPGLQDLRESFLASPWAHRTPIAIEVDVETPVGGVVVRSRIDAVFPDPDRPDDPDAVVVVDWKTGRRPTDPEAARSRLLQLAVYRLAWSRWTEVPAEKVGAAFFYVSEGVTVRPDDLPDEAELVEVLRPSAAWAD